MVAVTHQAVNTSPYIIAAVISAVPATLAALASWYSAHKGRKDANQGRKEEHNDHTTVMSRLEHISTKVDKLDIGIARLDLRFDAVEDKVERHLDWHRDLAGTDASLKRLLAKELPNDPAIKPHPDER